MIFLQIDPSAATNNLLQYGVLGAFSVLLLVALVFIFKLLISQVEKRVDQTQGDLNVERQARVELQKRFDEYQAEDRNKLMNLLENVQRVLQKVDAKL
jgi:cell division protein FtsX